MPAVISCKRASCSLTSFVWYTREKECKGMTQEKLDKVVLVPIATKKKLGRSPESAQKPTAGTGKDKKQVAAVRRITLNPQLHFTAHIEIQSNERASEHFFGGRGEGGQCNRHHANAGGVHRESA